MIIILRRFIRTVCVLGIFFVPSAICAIAQANEPQEPPEKPSGQPPALASKDDLDALRDLQVIRDSAVTVKKGALDLTTRLDYVRNSSSVQFSRAFISTTSIRYGLLPRVELSLNVPAYVSTRETQIGPTDYFLTNIRSLGDVSGQATATLSPESLHLPGLFGHVGFIAPTGPDPYWIPSGERPFAQPINPLYFTQSGGHWGTTAGLAIVKTLEPIIVFAGLSYLHFWPREFAGSMISPGDRYSYKAGFGLAVSERTMLGAAVQGTIAKDLNMDGIVRRGASAEAISLTLSLTQRVSTGFYAEPSVTLGMTSDAPSATVGIAVRKSF